MSLNSWPVLEKDQEPVRRPENTLACPETESSLQIPQTLLDLPVPATPPVFVTPSAIRRITEFFLFFVLTIVFLRTIAIEPFGVPTGSMAPTLTGNHRLIHCPECHYPIRFGEPTSGKIPAYIFCPNCDCREVACTQALEVQGDRLLVDKTVFQLRDPRRWEVAVFRCPSDLTKPYVKRVVGLPGEEILLNHGDVWINGKLARKELPEMLESMIPVWDMTYAPNDGSWKKRWRSDPMAESRFRIRPIDNPNVECLPDRLILRGLNHEIAPLKAFYIHLAHHQNQPGLKEQPIFDTYVYNQFQGIPQKVREFAMEFELSVQAGKGQGVVELHDSVDEVQFWYPLGQPGKARLIIGSRELAESERIQLDWATPHRIFAILFDRRAYLLMDEKVVLGPIDLPDSLPLGPISRPCKLGVQSANVTFQHAKIYRDIYYRNEGERYLNAVLTPMPLGHEDYYVLGDNSANSEDSRSWQIPGVPKRNFLGKPFVLHQPSRPKLIDVNGEQRLLQVLDWDRVRFIH